MGHAETDFSKIVAERLRVLDQNPYAIEKAFNLPPDAVRNVLRGAKKSGTPLNRAREICDALGLELYIGPPRETVPVARLSPEDREYVHIPLHDALLAAGGGALNSSEEIIDHLTFRADWLQGIGVSPSHARLGRASGLSMFPTIDDRDLVLMDVSKREPPVRRRPNGDTWKLPIYSFLDDGEARVKRIDRPESDLLILVSDNRDYPPEVRSGSQLQDLNIIGKVKWWAHTIRE